MKEFLVPLLSALFGTLGFAILFGVRPRHLVYTALCGGVTWVIYLLCAPVGSFFANTIAAFCMTMYCEGAARLRKAPVVTFLTPAIVVLVPGGSLYYTIANILSNNYAAAGDYGLKTLDACLGISAGILLASLCVRLFYRNKAK